MGTEGRTLAKVGGFHGILPNMNMLHRMPKIFFKPLGDDRKPEAPDYIWGCSAPDLPERETAWIRPQRGEIRHGNSC